MQTTNNQFILKAKCIHGNKYNYSKVNYINNKTKIVIICKIHGEFYQSPSNHISKYNKNGCPICAGKNKTTADFTTQCRIKHNDKYNYSLTNYKGYYSEIKIICPKHGLFLQRAGHHLEGSGCKQCGIENSTDSKLSNKKDFISKANKIHNNKYDYSCVIYKRARNPVKIICPKHGLFLQSPDNHICKAKGCPSCHHRISKGEIEFLNYYKIQPNNRQKYIFPYKVDGYDPQTNTIYEFLGDYYHGNPIKFDHKKYNKICHKTYGDLYNKTFFKLKNLKMMGYSIKYIWENDWYKFQRGIDKTPKILTYE